MIDHEAEDLIRFETCGHLIPGKPSRCTLYRWAFKGCRGVKLETLVCGHKRFVSKEAIKRFLDAQNSTGEPEPTISVGQRRRQSEAARKALAEIGI